MNYKVSVQDAVCCSEDGRDVLMDGFTMLRRVKGHDEFGLVAALIAGDEIARYGYDFMRYEYQLREEEQRLLRRAADIRASMEIRMVNPCTTLSSLI